MTYIKILIIRLLEVAMKQIIMSQKHIKFREMIKENRRRLVEAGFPQATLSRWYAGGRVPTQVMATKLSYVLNIPLSDIPHRVSMIL